MKAWRRTWKGKEGWRWKVWEEEIENDQRNESSVWIELEGKREFIKRSKGSSHEGTLGGSKQTWTSFSKGERMTV